MARRLAVAGHLLDMARSGQIASRAMEQDIRFCEVGGKRVAYATRLPPTSQKRMSCSMAREAIWPDRAMSRRWPATARRRAMQRTHARSVQSRYVDGIVIRPLPHGDVD